MKSRENKLIWLNRSVY